MKNPRRTTHLGYHVELRGTLNLYIYEFSFFGTFQIMEKFPRLMKHTKGSSFPIFSIVSEKYIYISMGCEKYISSCSLNFL